MANSESSSQQQTCTERQHGAFAGMTDTEINSLDRDDFADRLFNDFKGRQALVSLDDIKAIDSQWDKQGDERRMALLLLSNSFQWLSDMVKEDREFSVAVAQVMMATRELNLYREVLALLEQANLWAMLALCSRDDMEEVVAEAEATLKSR